MFLCVCVRESGSRSEKERGENVRKYVNKNKTGGSEGAGKVRKGRSRSERGNEYITEIIDRQRSEVMLSVIGR